jgi:PleD family two-component response regulator
MKVFDEVPLKDLDRRERQLTIFACLAIGILAVGTAVLMYPVVFGHQATAADKSLRNAFFGFCGLCFLLAGYLWERQSTVQRLRRQMAEERQRVAAAQVQASEELLKTMPHFSSFQDRLPMEYRRIVAMGSELSIVVVTLKMPSPSAGHSAEIGLLADAAKVVSRRLREQDSVYLLGAGVLGAVLPEMDASRAEAVSARIGEGLADAAGATNRFSYKLDLLNYPVNASSAHELLQGVQALLPSDDSIRALAEEAFA